MTTPDIPNELLEFPLVWHGRIIAHDRCGTAERIDAILAAPGFEEGAERVRTSSQGKYVSFRVSLTIPNRPVLDAVTESIEQIDEVKMVL